MTLGEIAPHHLADAVRVFLELAYPEGNVPANRQHFQLLSEEMTADAILGMKGVERIEPSPLGAPGGFAFRIGNAWYANMKMTVLAYGEEPGYVFGVDTHDAFNLPPTSPDFDGVRQLKERNLELAQRIERCWEERGLPTQKSMLRRYIERNRTSKEPTEQPSESPP